MESLQSTVDDARTALETAIGKNAVSQAERDSLCLQAESIQTLESQKKDATAALSTEEAALKKVEVELRANPSQDAKGEHACPHCEGKIHIKAVSGNEYILSKAEKANDADLKEARKKNADLCGSQQNLSRKVSDARAKLQAITSDLSSAAGAKRIRRLRERESFGRPARYPVCCEVRDLTGSPEAAATHASKIASFPERLSYALVSGIGTANTKCPLVDYAAFSDPDTLQAATADARSCPHAPAS